MYGEAGDDVLFGGLGDDSLFGGEGDDLLTYFTATAPGAPPAGVLAGNDTIDMGLGNDSVSASDVVEGSLLVNLGEGNDVYTGSGATVGADGRLSGNDTIYGGSGNDSITSGSASDQLFGGAGDDQLVSLDLFSLTGPRLPGEGPDTVDGGVGNDTIAGDNGDVLTGGEGADVFSLGYYDRLTAGTAALDWADARVDITDFRPGQDQVEIGIFGNPADTTIELVAAPAGAGTILRFGEDDVALLRGVLPTQLSAADIRVVRI